MEGGGGEGRRTRSFHRPQTSQRSLRNEKLCETTFTAQTSLLYSYELLDEISSRFPLSSSRPHCLTGRASFEAGSSSTRSPPLRCSHSPGYLVSKAQAYDLPIYTKAYSPLALRDGREGGGWSPRTREGGGGGGGSRRLSGSWPLVLVGIPLVS